VSNLKELESKRLAIRKRISELREELTKFDALREELYNLELDFTSVLDEIREAQKFS
jgi:hypothetical protein